MELSGNSVTYRRQGKRGVLTLSGVIDIFEAANLHAVGLKALNDKRAETLCIHLEQVTRLDLSAIQLLMALRRDSEQAGQACEVIAAPETVTASLAQGGFFL